MKSQKSTHKKQEHIDSQQLDNAGQNVPDNEASSKIHNATLEPELFEHKPRYQD